MTETAKKIKIVIYLTEKFEKLNLEERYKFLESSGLPAFVIQTVEIDGDSKKAAEEVYEYLAINAPDYLSNLTRPI